MKERLTHLSHILRLVVDLLFKPFGDRFQACQYYDKLTDDCRHCDCSHNQMRWRPLTHSCHLLPE